MKLVLSILLLFCLFHNSGNAQIYNRVTAINDTNFYADRYVVVSRNGLATSTTMGNCDASPYWIGLYGADGYKFEFTHPVKILRLQFFAINQGEQIAIIGNGSTYTLTNGNLSQYNCGSTNTAVATGGLLSHSTGTYSNATVDINFPTAMDSVRIQHMNGLGGGATFSFSFSWDTSVAIKQPFNYTKLCVGDSVKIPFVVDPRYRSNNVFTAQLSDKNGSFANPVSIGSINTDTNATINWVVPPTVSNGTGYRIRVVSSAPVRISEDNGTNIAIGNIDSAGITVSGAAPPVCEGSTISFSATCNVSTATYQWTGPVAFNANYPNPIRNTMVPAFSGNYYSIIKFHGCTARDTIAVTVLPTPSKPQAGSNSPLCIGDNIQLTAGNAGSGVVYKWSGPSGYTASGVQNPVINNSTPAMAGYYIVTADRSGCLEQDTIDVGVFSVPASVSATTNSPICVGDSLLISVDTSSAGVSYSWSGPNNFTRNGQHTFIAPATVQASGWYVATVSNNGCLFKDSTQVFVYPIPAKPVASYTSPVCGGETLRLSATTVNGASYNWKGPGNFTASIQNAQRPGLQIPDTGFYLVSATVNGCASPSDSVKVSINPTPFVVIQAQPGDTICQGDAATFIALPNNHSGTPTYLWYVNGIVASGSTISYSTTGLSNKDVVTCKMTEYTKCSTPKTDESNEIEMQVLPWIAPSVSITANPNRTLNPDEYITFTAQATNAGIQPAYQWKRNGQIIQGATGHQWSANTLNDNDIITVELYSSYRCPLPASSTSNAVTVRVFTSVNELNPLSRLRVYPNPAKDYVVFEQVNMESRAAVTLTVTNMLGQKVYETLFDHSAKTIWDTRNVTAGVYMYHLTSDGNQTYTNRLVITR